MSAWKSSEFCAVPRVYLRVDMCWNEGRLLAQLLLVRAVWASFAQVLTTNSWDGLGHGPAAHPGETGNRWAELRKRAFYGSFVWSKSYEHLHTERRNTE